MKKLYYEEGPDIMTCGIAGEFRRGVPRPVEDDLAEILLRKGRHKEMKKDPPEATAPAAPASPAKRTRKEE